MKGPAPANDGRRAGQYIRHKTRREKPLGEDPGAGSRVGSLASSVRSTFRFDAGLHGLAGPAAYRRVVHHEAAGATGFHHLAEAVAAGLDHLTALGVAAGAGHG